MAQIIPFPTPFPEITTPQDVSALRDILNSIIIYINSIAYGNNLANTALLKAQNLADLANAAAARGNLGLGSAATMSSTAFDAAGAAAAVLATSLQKASNLSDLANKPTARTNLGLGSAATMSSTAFDAAGAAAARAAKGVNSDITALTALKIVQETANYQVQVGDQTIEVNAASGAVTIIYTPATAAGRVKIVKTDATYNPINISDGTNTLYSLVAPANGLMQTVELYTTSTAIRVT